jgi:hypothetical protein
MPGPGLAGGLNMPIRSKVRMTAKEQLRDAIDALSEDEARDALRYLEVRRVDPVLAAFLAAPLDDEPVTEEEERNVAEARAEYRRGEASRSTRSVTSLTEPTPWRLQVTPRARRDIRQLDRRSAVGSLPPSTRWPPIRVAPRCTG